MNKSRSISIKKRFLTSQHQWPPRTYLWKDSHFTLSLRTTPDVISSSAKCRVSIPSSSCFWNCSPELARRSMESWEYMSSLKDKSSFALKVLTSQAHFRKFPPALYLKKLETSRLSLGSTFVSLEIQTESVLIPLLQPPTSITSYSAIVTS